MSEKDHSPALQDSPFGGGTFGQRSAIVRQAAALLRVHAPKFGLDRDRAESFAGSRSPVCAILIRIFLAIISASGSFRVVKARPNGVQCRSSRRR